MPLLRVVAGAEALAVLGLLGPGTIGVWLWATPVAALGLAVVMIGAAAIHLTQGEPRVAMLNLGLLLLAVFVGVGRIDHLR